MMRLMIASVLAAEVAGRRTEHGAKDNGDGGGQEGNGEGYLAAKGEPCEQIPPEPGFYAQPMLLPRDTCSREVAGPGVSKSSSTSGLVLEVKGSLPDRH